MAKKLWEILHEEAENNQQNRVETVRQANQQFDEYTSKKGTYDTTKHTTSMNNIIKAKKDVSKESANNFKRANNISLWDTIKNVANNGGYIAKRTGAGVAKGTAGIFQGQLTDMANNLRKGNKKSNIELTSNFLNSLQGLMNPMKSYNDMVKNLPTQIYNTAKNITDKDKNVLEKVTSLGMDSISNATENTSVKKFINSGLQVVGKIDTNSDEKVLNLNNKIAEPIDKMNTSLAKEGEKYGAVTNTLANVGESVGNMIPSIAGTTITKNPTVGLTTMGLSVKGQATQEALNKGAELDEAVKIGNTKAMVEVGTEMLTGGVNIFGKGALDDIVEKGIVNKVKNNVVKFFAKQGVNASGEVLEETISDLLGTVIDKGTIDPNATYTLKDWGDTAITTTLTTFALNLLTGGTLGDIEAIKNENKANKNAQKWINEAEKIMNQNNTSNLQQQSIQEQKRLSTQQIIQQENKIAQNQNMKQIDNNIKQYTRNDIERFTTNPSNLINGYNANLFDFINDHYDENTKSAKKHAPRKQEQKMFLGRINDNLSRQLNNLINNSKRYKKQYDLTDYNIVLSESNIEHSFNHHGNETKKDQIDVTPEIMTKYEDVVSNPDFIGLTDNVPTTREPNPKLYFAKKINGYSVAVEVISNKKQLYPKTYYVYESNSTSWNDFIKNNKLKEVEAMDSNEFKNSSEINVQDGIAVTSSINNSISQNKNSVKNNTITNNYMQNNENNTLNNKTLNPTEISNITAQDANTTPVLPTRNYKKGNKESSFFSNVVTDAKFLNKDLRQEIAHDENIRYYNGITNQETLEKAYNSLNEEGKNATLNWFNKDTKNVTAEDVAKGWILLKQYQDNGDYKSAVETAKKMRDMATGAGQAVQAYNILSRLTPEGMFYYAQSELNEAYNKMVEGKSQKWIKENRDKFDLTPEETKFIMDNMNEVANMEDGYEKKVKIAEIQKIVSDKIPPTLGQSVKSWMRISMLFNPKTQVRNITGNAVILPVNIGSDFISSGIDKVISKKTGVRTTGNINLKNYTKGFGKGLYESYNDFRKGINTRNIEGNRFEVSEGKNFKNKGIGKSLNRVDSLLSFMLDAGDRGFYEATFTNSINNQLVLNNTTEVTQEMIDIATNEALQRTWQDNNKYTEAVLKVRNILNYANVKGYGLGDILIPFAKTPANLTKAIVDYSPAGLAKTLTLDARTFKNSLKNGQFTPQMQHKFVQNLGKGMAGSFLYVLGYALAKAGIASGEADDDKDVKNFMKNSLGISSYSIKIGDKTFTYDWAQPVATPLAIMTNYVKYSEENPDANIIEKGIKSLNIGTEQLLEQSFMESLNTVLNGNGATLENLTQSVLELPARAIPTFSKQIADMVDGTQRTSFEYDKPLKSAVNSVIAKIPISSKTLPVSRDTFGNEIKKYGGENNLWNVMFNPANVNKGELSKAGEEVYRLYKETGETTIFPITAPYYINSKGEKITMTAEQRSNYQKVTGKYTEKAIEELLSNLSYKKLTDGKKAELITDIISDSNAKAKHDILNVETEEAKKKRELIEKVTTKNYYDYRLKTKDIEGEDATRRKNEVLLDANYSNNVKSILYTNTTGKEDSLYSILNNGNIDIDEYLEYKIKDSKDEFAADKDKNGNSISGSSKKKVYSYVNNNITGVGNRLIILGSKYKLQNSERQALTDYINKTVSNNNDKLEIFKKLSKNYTVKNGKVYYK